MEALRAMLKHADQYGLRYIFVRDRYYEPLLAFAGWRQTEVYDDGLVTLWTKDDVPPAKASISEMPSARVAVRHVGTGSGRRQLLSIFVVCAARSRRRRAEAIEFPAPPNPAKLLCGRQSR